MQFSNIDEAIRAIASGNLIDAGRKRHEPLVEYVAEARMPTRYGVFSARVYRSLLDGSEHMALVRGEVRGRQDVLVRVHSECMTGDILGSLRCDCGPQLQMALSLVAQAECGVVLYLRGHEGRGNGLAHKSKHTSYRTEDATLWKQASSSGCRSIRAATVRARRSCSISV